MPTDYANRSGNATNAFYRGEDSTAPTGSLVPLNPATAYSDLAPGGVSIFSGTASDTGGPAGENTLAKIQFRFLRNWTGANEYWNGTSWGSVTADLPISTTGPDGAGVTSWQSLANSGGLSLPSGETNLPSGRYSAQVVLTDTSANITTITSTIFISPLDSTAPTAAVTFPANNAVLSRLTEFRGTATDVVGGVPGSGVSRVLVRLKRQLKTGGTIEYWSGTAWTTSGINLNPISETSWVRNTSLPALTQLATSPNTPQDYNYGVLAAAQDRYNNVGSFATNNFTVEPNTAPNANAQSVTAIGHYGRAGDPANITLTATDGQNDAVTTYTVLTYPAHGTLSGTAPNLIYTADANYIGSDSFTFTTRDWGGVDGNTATVSINVVELAPVDALIKNSGDIDYTGDDIISADGSNQTVGQTIFANGKATYLIKVQKDDPADSLTLKVLGTAAASGWTVRYFDAQTNGLDITDQVTDEDGWHPILTANDTDFRVEVTPPANLAQQADLALLITAEQDGVANSTDAVKAVTTGQPTIQPDLGIKLASDHTCPD